MYMYIHVTVFQKLRSTPDYIQNCTKLFRIS